MIKSLPLRRPITAALSPNVPTSSELGDFYNEDFYVRGKSTYAAVLNMRDILGQAAALAGYIQHISLPKKLLANIAHTINFRESYWVKWVSDYSDPTKLTGKAYVNYLTTIFGSLRRNFKITRHLSGGATIQLCIGNTASAVNLSDVIDLINFPFYDSELSLNEQLRHFDAIGFDPFAAKSEFDIALKDVSEFHGMFPTSQLSGLANAKVVIQSTNVVAGKTHSILNPTTYAVDDVSTFAECKTPEIRAEFVRRSFAATNFNSFISFDLSPEEVAHATQQTAETASTADLGDWFFSMVSAGVSGAKVAPFRVTSSSIKDRYFRQNGGAKPKPRLGVLDMMVDPGSLRFVQLAPELDRIDEDRSNIESSRIVDGVYHYDAKTAALQTGDGIIWIDWLANRVLLRNSGVETALDIREYGEATPYHVRRFCETPRSAALEDDLILSNADSLLSKCLRIAAKLKLFDKADDIIQSGVTQWVNQSAASQVVNVLSGTVKVTLSNVRSILITEFQEMARNPIFSEAYKGKRLVAVLEEAFLLKNINEASPSFTVRWLSRVMGKVVDALATMADGNVIATAGLASTNELLVFRAEANIWNTFCRSPNGYARLIEADKTHREAYGKQPEDSSDLPEGYVPNELPNINPELALMPHQAKGAYSLEKLPKFAVLAVDAGGGKTIMILTDVLRKLHKGVGTMPAVYCPSHLLSNYVQDGNYASGGTLNVIPINRVTVDNFGKAYFEKLAVSRPPNTVFVIDYEFAKGDAVRTPYGSELVEVFGNAQWLRKLGFDMVWLDEAHYLKNRSTRTAAMRDAINDVPYRVLATGTMMQTHVDDVVSQMSLLDPGLFGSTYYYLARQGAKSEAYDFETGSTRSTTQWLATEMQRGCCVVKGKRKEWASMLPPRQTSFYWVELSKLQKQAYMVLLTESLEELKNDKAAMKIINSKDDDLESQLEAILARYLFRVERFLTAPSADDISQVLKFSPEELVSPKGKMIAQIVEDHMREKIPGKILVFTSYKESAKAVFDALPPELQAKSILYTAEEKMKCRELFEKDDDKILMVGVENSMNTGINAQFASRLIRVESVYSPGTLEQGESRINRPNVKSAEFRTGIYTDWVLVNGTVDVTKAGRLMSKTLIAQKFYNPGNKNYQELPDLTPIRLSFDSILAKNDFEETLSDYIDAYLTLENEVVDKEISEYREKNPNLVFVKQRSLGLLPHSKLLREVPYIPGGNLFNQTELGLVGLVEFLRDYPETLVKNLVVHTDRGDGYIVGSSKDKVQVKIDGQKFSFQKSEVFVSTKTTTSANETKFAMARNAGLDLVSVGQIDTPIVPQIPLPPPLPSKEVEPEIKPVTVVSPPAEPAGTTPSTTPAPEPAPVEPSGGSVNPTPEPSPSITPVVTPPVVPAPVDPVVPDNKPYDVSVTPNPDEKPLEIPRPVATPKPSSEEKATQGKIIVQFRETMDGGGWKTLKQVSDIHRHKPLVEQFAIYESYANKKVVEFSAKVNKDPKDCDVQLIDSAGFILFSTDSMDDWEAVEAKGVVRNVEPTVPAVQPPTPSGKLTPVPDAKEDGGVEVIPCYYNEFFTAVINHNDPDLEKYNVDLTKIGFVNVKPMGYMLLSNWRQAATLKKSLLTSGLNIPVEFMDSLDTIKEALKTQRTHFQQYRHLRATAADIRSFMLMRRRKLKADEIRPVILVCDGFIFVMIDLASTPAWSKLKTTVRVPGTKWEVDESSYHFYGARKADLVNALKELRKLIPISNMEEVKEALRGLTDAARKKLDD